MVVPEDYYNSESEFMRGEVARAYANGRSVRLEHFETTSLVRPWGNEVDTVAVRGLFGCTSFIVVSTRGVLAYHFWEQPTYGLWDKTTLTTNPTSELVFLVFAIDPLDHTNQFEYHQAGILNLRTDSGNHKTLDWLAGHTDMF